MDKIVGGYFMHPLKMITYGAHRHTVGLPDRPVSALDLRVTNLLQRVPRRVNRWLLDVVGELLAQRDTCPLIPSGFQTPMPERWADEAWEAASEEDKKRQRRLRGDIHEANESRRSSRRAWLECYEGATEMASYPSIYFVWNQDFRGRRYCVPAAGMNPQGTDFQKSMLHFADGVPLGKTGLYWLCIRAANSWGHDKLQLNERFAWAMNNIPMFEEIAAAPGEWRKWVYRNDKVEKNGEPAMTEEPWAFLVTCHELAAAFREKDYKEFVSHLSVPLDGTANGLQHLSMAGRDPVGALATNLTCSKERRDIYIEVATAASKIVSTHAAQGNAAACLWYGKVDRNSVKRTVLATPYGITDGGIARQLIGDKIAPSSDLVTVQESAGYFRDVLVEALSGTVSSAKDIMAWFQSSAQRLAEAGLPMDWTTPTGSFLRQAYRPLTARRVTTLAGRIQAMEEVPGATVEATRQKLGAAPNIVHSWDGSHLALTVALTADMGLTSWDMIHDSYGTHAGNTQILSEALRRTFVDMHAPNLLERLAEGWAKTGVDIAAPPAQGGFDPQQVLQSDFFFS